MSEQKTHAEIIARMRSCAEEDEYTPDGILGQTLHSLADSLEAAHERELDALNEQITDLRQQRDLWSKRAAELVEKCNEQYAELKQVGNCAKLREALTKIRDICNRVGAGISPLSKRYKSQECQAVFQCFRNAAAALSAPPRNCDIGTVDEQKDRFLEFCDDEKGSREHCRNCRLCNSSDCELAWAQMPYIEKEGGAR